MTEVLRFAQDDRTVSLLWAQWGLIYHMEDRKIFIVAHGDEGKRLDVWLTRQLDGISRSRIQQLIREGSVKINSRPVRESHKTRTGEQVEIIIPAPRPVELKPEKIPLNILFEDDFLLVINKPAGMVVHPAPGHDSGTLVNAILYHCPKLGGIGGESRPGIVHRLDEDTSGVILVAKTGAALAALAGQFKQREISKEYLAIVLGSLSPSKGQIRTLIGRHAVDRKKMSAAPKKGRLAVTRYETLEKFEKYSLLKLLPETGRTHQLRVHLAHLQHPVAGDKQYGKHPVREIPVDVDRQMLHAHKICFRHPVTGQQMEFSVPIPSDMARLLEFFRQKIKILHPPQK